jgi:hypothetical protein
MDVFDHNIVARVLLTLVTIGYGFVTILADFNKTHATNPVWTPHARFHVVWQIASYTGVAVLALALIWVPGPFAAERLYLAGALAGVVYGAFFVALAAMPLYGGRTHDDNGYLPLAVRIGRLRLFDVNVSAFSLFTVVLIGALIAISRTGAAG